MKTNKHKSQIENMKRYIIKTGFGFLTVLMIFNVSLRAENTEGLVDVRGILESAEEALFQNGVSKTTSVAPMTGGGRTLNTYYYKNKAGEKFTLIESISNASGAKKSDITIVRPDGIWSLSSGAAIREPDELTQSRRSNDIVLGNTKPIMGTMEDCVIDENPCIRITVVLTAEHKDRMMQNAIGMSKNAGSPEMEARAKKAMANMARLLPHRIEYLINKDTGIIMATRRYLENGKLRDETNIKGIERNCDFDLAKFELPKDFKIIFSDNMSEYTAALQNMQKAKQNQNKTTKKSNRSTTTNNR
jgi:hypothetical protein